MSDVNRLIATPLFKCSVGIRRNGPSFYPTTMRLLQRFFPQYKQALAWSSAFAASLVLGTTVSAWQAAKATATGDQANVNEKGVVCTEQNANSRTVGALENAQESNAQPAFGHAMAIIHMSYSPDGRRLATGSQDRTVKVWDVQTGRELLSLTGHTKRVSGVAFSPDGKRLASASDDNDVRIWDAQTGREIRMLKGGGQSVAYSPDGQRIACTSQSAEGVVSVRDVQTDEVLLTLTPRMQADVRGHHPIIAYSLDGMRIACARGSGITVWDTQSGKELLWLQGGTGCVAFNPDGKSLASGSNVWDVQTGEELFSLKGQPRPDALWSVAFSPDGKRLATKSGTTVTVWNAQTGKELLRLPSGYGHGVIFSPDGHYLAGIGPDTKVKIWEVTPLPE